MTPPPISRMFRKRLTPVANMQTTVKVTCAASEARESREGVTPCFIHN